MSVLDGSGAVHTVFPWEGFSGHVPPGGSFDRLNPIHLFSKNPSLWDVCWVGGPAAMSTGVSGETTAARSLARKTKSALSPSLLDASKSHAFQRPTLL